MDMSKVKRVYNYKSKYSVHVMKDGTFQVVSPFNTVEFTTYSFNLAAQKAKRFVYYGI